MKKEIDDIPPKYSVFANRLVKKLLYKDPNDRPTIEELFDMPEISKIVI